LDGGTTVKESKTTYTTTNFKTKKALKEAVIAGKDVGVYQPGLFSRGLELEGNFTLEGPHYPEPHRWYAEVTVKDRKIVKVR